MGVKNTKRLSFYNVVTIVGVLALIMAGVSLVLYITNSSNDVSRETRLSPDLSKNIHLTLKRDPIVDSGESSITASIIDVSKYSEGIVAPSYSKEISELSFSSDGQWITFVSINQNLLEEDGTFTEADDSYTYQVFRANIGDSNLEEAVKNAEQVTDVVAAFKILPSINNSGEILYMSRGDDTNEFNTETSSIPSDWTVHHINVAGRLTDLTTGMYPQWIDEDELLYISSEGLIHHYIKGSESLERKVNLSPTSLTEEVNYDSSEKPEEMTSNPNSIFDISDNGEFIVVSLPNLKKTYSYRMTRQEDDTIELKPLALLLDSVAAWPQISPDNMSVGMFEYGPPRYVIYSLETFEPLTEPLYMESLDLEGLKITDWY